MLPASRDLLARVRGMDFLESPTWSFLPSLYSAMRRSVAGEAVQDELLPSEQLRFPSF